MSNTTTTTNTTTVLTPFQSTFSNLGISSLPTITSFVLHPDERIPSIVALSLLLLAAGKYSGRMVVTEGSWRRLRGRKWFGGRGREEQEDEEGLRGRTKGVGGLRGVERWRGRMFGEKEDPQSGKQRDQGRLVASFVILLFFFTFPTIWSLVSFRPTDGVLCGLVGVVSFLLLASTRYAALFKVSLDLQQARGRRVPGTRGWGGEAAKRWEVLGLRAFVVVGIIMSLFSSIFSRGFLRVLPPPFDSSAICFRRTFLLYSIPLSLNLALSLYSLGRIFVISHWRRNPWSAVLADGRVRRAGVFSIWVVSSFAQELAAEQMSGSGMWLPTCLGAGAMMAVMESPPYLPQPPPAPANTPQPTIRSSSTIASTHARPTSSNIPPFTSFLNLNSPPSSRSRSLFPPASSKLPLSSSHKSNPSNPQLVVALNNAQVHEAFRQDFNSFKLRKSEEEQEESDDEGQDIVNQAATEPSTVFYAPSISSPVTINSEVSALREGEDDGKWEMMKSSSSSDDNHAYGGILHESRRGSVIHKPNPNSNTSNPQLLFLPRLPFPTHPRRLEDSTILNHETKILRVSQHLHSYSIPRPFTPSTQGGQTTTTDSHFPYRPHQNTTVATATISSVEQRRMVPTLPSAPVPVITQARRTAGQERDSVVDASLLPDPSSPSIQDHSTSRTDASSAGLAPNLSIRTARTFGTQQQRSSYSHRQQKSSSSARSFASNSSSSSSSSDLPPPGPPPPSLPFPKTPAPAKGMGRGLPASPKGPETPPKDTLRVVEAVEGKREREREKRAPRVKTFDFSVSSGMGEGEDRGGGQGSLGDFRF